MCRRAPGGGVRGIPRGLLWLVPASDVGEGRQSSRQVRSRRAPPGRETVRGGMQQIDRGRRGRRATTRSLLARPLSKPGRAPRAEPLHNTIMRHARAFRGPGRSTIKFCNLIGVCFPGRAVKGRKFGDQLGDGHPELGCSGLEHIRSVLVDLDADAGVHGTRIADPETVGSIPARPTTAVRFPSAVIAIVDRKLLRGCPGCSPTAIDVAAHEGFGGRRGAGLRRVGEGDTPERFVAPAFT
jgi:hypothetical protein